MKWYEQQLRTYWSNGSWVVSLDRGAELYISNRLFHFLIEHDYVIGNMGITTMLPWECCGN